MANIVLLKKSSVSGKIPLTTDLDYGEVALNYADGKLYYKTSGNTISSIGNTSSASFTQIDRKSYIATSGQTTFSVTYASSYVDVYLNGQHLTPTDYTATSGTSIVLTIAAVAGDELDLVGYSGTLLSTSSLANGDILRYNSTTGLWNNSALITTNVAEGSNLYFTTARARTAVSATGSLSYNNSTGVFSFTQGNTDTVSEGSTNLYYTDARSRAAISATGSLSYSSSTGVISFTQGNTDTVSEGTSNLYFTNTRARNSISASSGITYNSTSGALSLTNSGVTAGSYGSASAVPVITVDASGRITSASTTAVAGVSNVQYNTSTGILTVSTSSGTNYTVDLGIGTTESPTFAGSVTLTNSRIQSDTATTTAVTANQVLVSLDATLYRSVDFIVQATDSTNGKYHTTTVKAIHNGTTANSTEFGSVNVGGVCATFTADYSSGSLRLLCTPASSASTVYKITSIINKL
jgi:hypothetical protein